MKTISIIVSVYNEEACLRLFMDAFLNYRKNIRWNTELIFVNDGSSDSSYQILKEFETDYTFVRLINFSRNFGHEAAMIAGIDYATGDGLICMDADLQHPLECIAPVIEKFEEGYDVISMVRTSNTSAGLIKNITSKAFYKMINSLSVRTHFEENASDFFALSRRAADILQKNYREKVRFLRGYVQSIGFNKTTLEYEAAERAGGKSHYSIKSLLRFSITAIVTFSELPLKLGIYAGLLSSLLGFIVLIYTLFTFHSAPSGYATIVILICFLFAILFLIIGIVGEYLSVLFAEIKDRPIYIIEDMSDFSNIEEEKR